MRDEQLDRRLRGLGHLVGNTPLLVIELSYHGEQRKIYAKAENLNMTGSIKDRMALHIIEQGYARGHLKPGAPIVEATSGNTGISIAGIGRKVGKHRIQGISDEFIPPIVDLDYLDEVISVDDGDAIIMAQRLASELGIGVGISSGANFIGALKAQNEIGADATVVTIFPDDNKKYLSTDLLREEPVKDGFLSPDIELYGFGAFKRVCQTCCDPIDCVEADHLDGEVDPEMMLPHCPRRP